MLQSAVFGNERASNREETGRFWSDGSERGVPGPFGSIFPEIFIPPLMRSEIELLLPMRPMLGNNVAIGQHRLDHRLRREAFGCLRALVRALRDMDRINSGLFGRGSVSPHPNVVADAPVNSGRRIRCVGACIPIPRDGRPTAIGCYRWLPILITTLPHTVPMVPVTPVMLPFCPVLARYYG